MDWFSFSHAEFAPLLTPDGTQRVQEFITSLNVYGATPFLYPIYGGGDVLQSFCRINNVYAGITMLQTQVVSVIVRKKDSSVIAMEVVNESIHTVIRCRNVIASDDYPLAETDKANRVTANLAHGILLARGKYCLGVSFFDERGVQNDEQGRIGDLRLHGASGTQ